MYSILSSLVLVQYQLYWFVVISVQGDLYVCMFFSHPAGLVMSETYFRFHYIAFSKYSEYIFIQIK